MLEPKEIRHRIKGSSSFYSKKHSAFAHVPDSQWEDWRWHVRNRIASPAELQQCIPLSIQEKRAIQMSQGRSRFSLTPYWVSLMDLSDIQCPIRRQALPSSEEFRSAVFRPPEVSAEGVRVAGGRLVHLHSDRAVLHIHSQCIVYCRFCPKKRNPPNHEFSDGFLPETESAHTLLERDWNDIHFYLESHPQISEIILSGGEPLLLEDEVLEKILARLKAIRSIRSLRLETRILSFLPQRVTPELVHILKSYQPLYWMAHVNHPREITPEFVQACERLTGHGIPLASNTVLLRGVNDKIYTLSELFSTLYKLRVRPYRLIQCQPQASAEHFRTSVSVGLKLIESLRCRMSSLSLPEYVVDTAGGKIPLRFESVLSRNKKRVLLKNHEGKIYVYPEKIVSPSA